MPTTPTISIIDDDVWARQGINDLVTSLGYRTITFASAEEFLGSDHIDTTDCVISDLQMPGLSGLELQEKLMDRQRRPAIILVTAYPDERSKERALDAGAFGYLTKPFDEDRLVQCLFEATGRPGH